MMDKQEDQTLFSEINENNNKKYISNSKKIPQKQSRKIERKTFSP